MVGIIAMVIGCALSVAVILYLIIQLHKDRNEMKIRKVCGTCGSDNVVADAWACWDEDAQEWVLDNVFDYEYCRDCDGDTSAKDVPLEVTKEDE